MSETSLNELKINYLTEEQYNNAKNSGNINNNELYMTPDDGSNGEGGIIVSPTEPQTDRRKVWFQKGTDTNAIYVKNDNGEYEEFIRKENLSKIEEIKITSLLNGATINNGWQNKLSRIGNLCHIELAFVPNTTNNIAIYQIPEEFIPKMSTIGLVMRDNLIGKAFVTASNNGQIQVQVPSNADVTWVLNATWFI